MASKRSSAALGLALAAVLGACAAEEASAPGLGLGLRDPLDLIDDVQGNLRLLVFPAETHACDAATGLVTPSPFAMDARPAEVPEAVVDITVSPAEPTATVQLDPGSYSVLVVGWGTDVVSGRENFLIASGCAADVSIERGETQEIGIDLIQQFGEGLCGDGMVSPDEQCDDTNTVAGDGCSDTCHTEPFTVAVPPDMMANEQSPAVAWAAGARMPVVYDSDEGASRDIRMMLLSESASIITTPTALSLDGPVLEFAGVQTAPVVSLGGGRIGVAWTDFRGGADPSDVRVRFFDTNRTALGADTAATDAEPTAGAQAAPAIALAGDGSALVVFENAMSATGLSGAFFAAGSTTHGGSFEVGAGATGGATPAVAALPEGFVVAFTAAGDVRYQRFDATGAPVDDAAAPVLEDAAGTQDQPTVAALPDGRVLFAWRDSAGDGAGTAVRARVFAEDGTAVGGPVLVNTTTAGDQANPAAAAGASRFVVAFTSGAEIRASVLNADGMLALNRQPEPAPADFAVASGAGGPPAVATGGTAAQPVWIAVWQTGGASPDVQGRLFPLP